MLDDFASEDTRVDRRDRRRPRWGRRILLVIASLMALTLAAAGGFVVFLDRKVSNNITQEDLLPADRPPVTAPDGTTVPETGVGTNFLVVGADTRPGDAGRSDVIVLAHLPEDGSQV
ncbi:MAG: LytR family transcriptional regulator, partial [Terracoccus sp.]